MVISLCDAFFAASEIALLQVNDSKMRKLAEEGNKKARKLQKLTDEPSRFLATIQVAITLSGFIGAAFAADNFADRLVQLTNNAGLEEYAGVLKPAAVILVTLILSYITLVFGELVPKRAAMKNSEKLALSMAGGISAVQTLFAPLVWILNISTNGVLKLMGIKCMMSESLAEIE